MQSVTQKNAGSFGDKIGIVNQKDAVLKSSHLPEILQPGD